MRHFIAYHNSRKMGHALADGDPLKLVSNKPINHLYDNLVWFIQGDDAGSAKTFTLASAFVVSEVGETGQTDFKRFVRGNGHVFRPPVPLNDLPWFAELFKTTAHFSLGVQQLKLESTIHELKSLAAQAGWNVPDDVDDRPTYPEPKSRELSEGETTALRERITAGATDIYLLAQEFDCSASQIAGIKAAMTREGDLEN